MKLFKHLLYSFVFLLSYSHAGALEKRIVPEESNFLQLSKKMHKTNKGLLLMIHSEHCHYCEVMDEQILSPMIRSGEYKKKIFIRKLQVDKDDDVINFKGSIATAFDIASDLDAQFTPTLLFLNSHGQEKATKLVGLNSIDFIGARIDAKISDLMKSISTKKDSQ